ncbi:amidase, partial [Candidatus Entotheonella serta]
RSAVDIPHPWGLVSVTYPLNLTGHPALSLPCGLTSAGLPIGLQLIGPWHSERRLLEVAERLETVLPWGHRHPPL